MSNDRELLELAAQAAKIELVWSGGMPKEITTHWNGNYEEAEEQRVWDWNPLTDDGDALRLAIKLDLSIRPHTWGVGWVDVGLFKELTGGDPMAATRRAIVRAAAAMAKTTA